MLSVTFITQGCKVNQYETQAMRELLLNHGYRVVDENENADVYVINTCTVTHTSDRKARQIIRRAIRQNSDAFIVVTGCYANGDSDAISQIDGVDLILPNRDKARILEYLKDPDSHLTEFKKDTRFDLEIENFAGQTRAFIKVQDGCNSFCSYCIIPYVRGRSVSRPIESIVNEARKLSANGYSEIVLTGIHLMMYGDELSDNTSIADVIEAIEPIDRIKRIRLSSIEPMNITDEIIDRLVTFEKLAPHFHISLQSGSDEILRRMRREYTTEQYAKLVDKIRMLFPNVGITSDIMVGFPGEKDKHFDETCKFIEAMKFGQLHVFRYSPRTGTAAANFSEQVSPKIAKERSQIVRELGKKLYKDFRRKMLGKKMKVLVEDSREGKRNWLAGFTGNYIRTILDLPQCSVNKMILVKLTELEDDLVVAEPA